MKYMREMIQKGDPRVSMLLPNFVINELLNLAKAKRRRYQDELIKNIARTFRFPEVFANLEPEVESKILAYYKPTGEKR